MSSEFFRFLISAETKNRAAENFLGGGHACASGATVHSKAEIKALVADADKLLKEYKANNKGWL